MVDTANHIGELNQTLPPAGGPVGEGDDEIRVVKKVLVNDFAGINAPVYEDADTSGVGGSTPVTSQTMSSWEARISKNATDISSLQAQGIFVVGMILAWSPFAGAIPGGWALCDGSLANGQQTPDLRDRFVLAAGGANPQGTIGGSATDTTTSAGAHTHPITVDSHTLTTSQIPSHDHDMFTNEIVGSDQGTPTTQRIAYGGDNLAQSRAYKMQPSTLSADVGRTGVRGGNQGHTHTANSTSAGAHTHEVDTVPPFYSLTYIMYVGT